MITKQEESVGYLFALEQKGGPGSGNFGHAGVPGQLGGSASGVGASGGESRRSKEPYIGRNASGKPVHDTSFAIGKAVGGGYKVTKAEYSKPLYTSLHISNGSKTFGIVGSETTRGGIKKEITENGKLVRTFHGLSEEKMAKFFKPEGINPYQFPKFTSGTDSKGKIIYGVLG